MYHDITPAITSRDYKDPLLVGIDVIGTTNPNRHSTDDVHGVGGVMSTMCNRDYKSPKQIAIPVLTPDREEKRQNGRRFKDNMEPMFTLTAQDIHGCAIGINTMPDGTCRTLKNQYQKNSSANFAMDKGARAASAAGVKIDGVKTNECHPGIYVELYEGCTVYAVWYEKYQSYIAIRKLTPRECFRLQGWTDDYYEKAEFVNSNSQLYKQAGNGVTVNVVYEIAKALKGVKDYE